MWLLAILKWLSFPPANSTAAGDSALIALAKLATITVVATIVCAPPLVLALAKLTDRLFYWLTFREELCRSYGGDRAQRLREAQQAVTAFMAALETGREPRPKQKTSRRSRTADPAPDKALSDLTNQFVSLAREAATTLPDLDASP